MSPALERFFLDRAEVAGNFGSSEAVAFFLAEPDDGVVHFEEFAETPVGEGDISELSAQLATTFGQLLSSAAARLWV